MSERFLNPRKKYDYSGSGLSVSTISECTHYSTYSHRVTKIVFIGPWHLPTFWGKKEKTTTKVTLTSHQNQIMNYVCRSAVATATKPLIQSVQEFQLQRNWGSKRQENKGEKDMKRSTELERITGWELVRVTRNTSQDFFWSVHKP